MFRNCNEKFVTLRTKWEINQSFCNCLFSNTFSDSLRTKIVEFRDRDELQNIANNV
jgi:hypothetical protein